LATIFWGSTPKNDAQRGITTGYPIQCLQSVYFGLGCARPKLFALICQSGFDSALGHHFIQPAGAATFLDGFAVASRPLL
jgi:hypothetical protein